MRKITEILRNIYSVTYDAAVGYIKDDAATHSAAVTYYLFLAIIPVAVMSVSICTYIFGSSDNAYAWVMNTVSEFSPDIVSKYGNEIRNATEEVIRARGTALSFGILSLIWISLNAVCALEHSINNAWKLTITRNPFMRRFVSLLFLLMIGLMLYASTFFHAIFLRYFTNIAGKFDNVALMLRFLAYFSSYVIYFFSFLLLYWVMVRISVPVKAILYSAFAGSIVWGISKSLFSWFVINFSQYSKIYGSIAGIMIFMIWLYFSVVIIIFFAEVGYAISVRCGKR